MLFIASMEGGGEAEKTLSRLYQDPEIPSPPPPPPPPPPPSLMHRERIDGVCVFACVCICVSVSQRGGGELQD